MKLSIANAVRARYITGIMDYLAAQGEDVALVTSNSCNLPIVEDGEEGVKVDRMLGHGGYFKTPLAGQKIAAAMVGAPVSVMETAGEGGAWGIAVLAQYTVAKLAGSAQTLQQFLDSEIFASMKATTIAPDAADVAGCEEFMKNFRAGL